jgi:nucleoside-diphosphate-sugar epimerase
MNHPPANRPTVLILGANGRLGCAAANAFSQAGWQVLVQTRRQPALLLPKTARVLHVDLSDWKALANAAAHASVVVHAINPTYTKWATEALPALHAGLAIAEQLKAHFILPGNVYNFGAMMPPLLCEDTPQLPTTDKGRIRVEMEAEMARCARAGGFAASVVRAGDFFGAGMGSWLDLVIVKHLRAGKLVYPGPMDLVHAWAYLPDLARMLVRVAAQPLLPGFFTWNFKGYSLTGHELLAAIEVATNALGVTPAAPYRHVGMPWKLIRVGGLLVPAWREVAKMAYLWSVPHQLEESHLVALQGQATYNTPLVVALRDALHKLGFGTPKAINTTAS